MAASTTVVGNVIAFRRIGFVEERGLKKGPLMVVFPVLITLIVVAGGSVSLHEHAMQSLVVERDERAVRAASDALADRFAQRQLLLRLFTNQLADGVSLAS